MLPSCAEKVDIYLITGIVLINRVHANRQFRNFRDVHFERVNPQSAVNFPVLHSYAFISYLLNIITLAYFICSSYLTTDISFLGQVESASNSL